MEKCQICVETFTKSRRKRVECPDCRESFCTACVVASIRYTGSARCLSGCGCSFSKAFVQQLVGAYRYRSALKNFLSED